MVPSELSQIEPWNSIDYPVTVNSIRYNQDYSLFTLGTSKGYRIFQTNNLKSASIETETIRNLGDLNIVMTYYRSQLVFFLGNKNNQMFSRNELVAYDDLHQKKIASFKMKQVPINNFYISKNVIFIMALNQIFVLEIFSFKVIDIIENVYMNNKLLTYNFNDYISYIRFTNKKKILTNMYFDKKHIIYNIQQKSLIYPFSFVQLIQISPKGTMLALVSLYGNKIHLYNISNSKLRECIYLGNSKNKIEKLCFSKKKENYILIMLNTQKFYIYKTHKKSDYSIKCICSKYDDKDLDTSNSNFEEEEGGFFGFFRKYTKNLDIKDIHAFSKYVSRPLFIDFEFIRNRELTIINKEGKVEKFKFNKDKEGKITPFISLEWI